MTGVVCEDEAPWTAGKIAEALRRTDTRAAAAELLGISTRTLAAKMKELGIEE